MTKDTSRKKNEEEEWNQKISESVTKQANVENFNPKNSKSDKFIPSNGEKNDGNLESNRSNQLHIY